MKNFDEKSELLLLLMSLKQASRFPDALHAAESLIRINPNEMKFHYQRAECLFKMNRNEDAVSSLKVAIEIEPRAKGALTTLGGRLCGLRKFDEAIGYLNRAIELDPNSVPALVNLGICLRALGKVDEAEAQFERALALDPTINLIHVNLATTQLMKGLFHPGWRNYERRFDPSTQFVRHGFNAPVWRGETSISGKTILVHAERGLGDTIQFCRYVPMLEDAGARVLFAPQRALHALMKTLGGNAELVNDREPNIQSDCHSRLLSLPLAFGTTVETIPGNTPYLFAEPGREARWRNMLKGPEFKIGVNWHGSDNGTREGRSFPLAALRHIAEIEGVRLISLQTGAAISQLATMPTGMKVEILGDDYDTGDQAFLDCAAVIRQCDLIISCDTSVAHLSGALDQRTWIAAPFDSCWRWMLGRSDTPWYPKTKLFRQTIQDDWISVFADMAAELREQSLIGFSA